jgi:hypothetical protein
MTRLINEAYSTIEHAPLRYHVEANPPVQKNAERATCTSADESTGKGAETFPKTDRLEFWVRFVCGAVFGAFVSFRLSLDSFEHPAILVLLIVGVMLGFGFAAARYGDKFWQDSKNPDAVFEVGHARTQVGRIDVAVLSCGQQPSAIRAESHDAYADVMRRERP